MSGTSSQYYLDRYSYIGILNTLVFELGTILLKLTIKLQETHWTNNVKRESISLIELSLSCRKRGSYHISIIDFYFC